MCKPLEALEVSPAGAKAFHVERGQFLRIIDLEGQQVGDFIAFNLHQISEKFSAGRTRTNNFKLRVTTDDRLFSNACNVMFTIVEDTCGVHDLLYPPVAAGSSKIGTKSPRERVVWSI